MDNVASKTNKKVFVNILSIKFMRRNLYQIIAFRRECEVKYSAVHDFITFFSFYNNLDMES
jgi:hypothetical protein